MEGEKCEEIAQKAMDTCQDPHYKKPSSMSLKSPQTDAQKLAIDTKIAAPTPEKANEPVRDIHKNETTELPENFKVVAELFNHMTCSLRLLSLRQKLPSFETISRQVEVLSGRKFSCKHLSQIKHVLPEAVHTDKILLHDKKTLCMKPDIKITLSFAIIEGHQEQSPFIALHQLFTSRLLDMAAKFPMVCEIPEAEMPEPFNQKRIDSIKINPLVEDLATKSQQCSSQTELLNSTHVSPFFNRRFSMKMDKEDEKKTPLLASQIVTTSSRPKCFTDQDIKSISESTHVTTTASETTPLKVELESGDLSLQTPAQLTPQRSGPSCDNKLKTVTTQIVTPLSAKRSLDFTIMEGGENVSESTSDEAGMKSLDHTLRQAITKKEELLEDNFSSTAVLGKVEGEKSQCCSKDLTTKQTMPAGLTDLIAVIHQIFQSVSCSAMTKDELIYKILINNCEIVERKEVEEQIGLLEKLVPDWICNKVVASGDVLYNIKKQLDPTSVCNML